MRSKSRSRAASTSARAIVGALAIALGAGSAAASPFETTALALHHATPLELAARAAAARPSDTNHAPASLAFAAASGAARAEGSASRPGKRKALLYSLLLPGAGELSLGAKGRAAGFFVAEGLIWTHYVWYQVAGHLRRDEYIELAQLNAGVGVSDASDDYWRIVGQYERSSGAGPGSYEEDIRREAREIHPDDPAAQDAYVAENLPSGDRAWAWSDADLQKFYRDKRANSNRAFDRAKYSFAAAILNRLISAIDTQVIHRRLELDDQANLDRWTRLVADALPEGGARVQLLRRF
jgi:hypothetical protein